MNEVKKIGASEACALKLTSKQKKMLCASGWLSTCPKAFQEDLLNLGAVELLQAGETLYNRGKIPQHAHGLISGQIDILLLSKNNEELVYPHSGSSRWYCMADVITQEKAVATAIARKPTLVLSISEPEFTGFLEAEPKRYREIVSHYSAQRRQLQETITDLVTFDGVILVAKRLLWMMDTGRLCPDRSCILSQHDLAGTMGLSVPTIQRAFRQLKSEGVISTDYGKFCVQDRNRLMTFLDRIPQ